MTPDLPHEAYLTALSSLKEVGPGRLRWMLTLGRPDEVWSRVRAGRLPRLPRRVGPDELRSAWRFESAGLEPGRCWDRCIRLGVGVVSLGGAGYPPALSADRDPPVVLFHLGDPDRMAARRVAIVGTRRATGYGLGVATDLGGELSLAGVSVVSGLALGIDAAAHRGSVEVDDGAAPVAVVAGGLDAPCPRRNRPLADIVAARGVVVSEAPPGVRADRWRFPVRNRVIAALSDLVVVVESPGAGGSMHTVREAMDRDLPVCAVPGPIDSRASEGTNRLIADGALVATCAADVLMALPGGPPVSALGGPKASGPVADRRPAPTGAAAVVLDAVGWRPVSMEQLAGACSLDFGGISRAVTELESAGWVRRSGGWVERVARPAGP